MKVTPEERAARRAAFGSLSFPERVEYIFDYYKFHILLGVLALALLVSGVRSLLTRKETLLYVGCCNVALGDSLLEELTEGYLRFTGEDINKNEVYVFAGLYLSDDPAPENHEYSYASRLKLMASVNAKQMDLVLMNQEAYGLLSGDGYLLELPGWLSQAAPELHGALLPWYAENRVVLRDNSIEYNLNEAESYSEETEDAVNGILLNELPCFAEAAFPAPVYLGVIANSERLPAAENYIRYLLSEGSE